MNHYHPTGNTPDWMPIRINLKHSWVYLMGLTIAMLIKAQKCTNCCDSGILTGWSDCIFKFWNSFPERCARFKSFRWNQLFLVSIVISFTPLLRIPGKRTYNAIWNFSFQFIIAIKLDRSLNIWENLPYWLEIDSKSAITDFFLAYFFFSF